ncbi:MAG: sugar transferase [Desulfobulbaceae bacterium]|nr:sugar transferase [Desulfobulbaceae bacterium]
MYDDRTVGLDRFVSFLDILLTTLAFLASYQLRNMYFLDENISFFSHMFILPLQLAILLGFLSYFGAYNSPRRTTLTAYCWAIFRAVSLSVGVLLALLFFLKITYISRIVILLFAIIEFFVLFATRIGVKKYFRHTVRNNKNPLRVLIIGTGERALELTSTLQQQAEWGLEIVGYLDPDQDRVGSKIFGAPVLGTIADIHECLKKHVVDEVIIGIPRSLLEDAEPIAWACAEEGIKLRFMADVFNLQVARVSLAMAGAVPLLTLEPVVQDEAKLFLKRIFDLVLTCLAMPLFLPILALTAIAIKLDSPGPVFFIQQRVGLRKHLFPMFKFRSMFVDAEEKLKEIEHLNEADGPIFKIKNDPRITRVGNFIRKTSIDELPQLFNVLRGEMSLVGPRPMSIRDVDLFDKGIQRKRFSVKPGITCIWQVSGRSNLPFDKWLKLDLEYIDRWSFGLDLEILLKTVPAVLKSKGAS